MADDKIKAAVKILKEGLASTVYNIKEENISIQPGAENGLLITIKGSIIAQSKAEGIALGLTSAGATGVTYPQVSVASNDGNGTMKLNYSGNIDQLLALEPKQISGLVGFHCSAEKARVTKGK